MVLPDAQGGQIMVVCGIAQMAEDSADDTTGWEIR